MRVAVVGSRTFSRLDLVRELVRSLEADTVVVSGGARGVDRAAEIAAKRRGLVVDSIPADWNTYGLRAGFMRNGDIVARSDEVHAFLAHCTKCPAGTCPQRGWSHGTMDSMRRAIEARKPLTIVLESGLRRRWTPSTGRLPDELVEASTSPEGGSP